MQPDSKPNPAWEERACERGGCVNRIAGPWCRFCSDACAAAPAVEPEQSRKEAREFMVQHKGAYEALVDEPEQPYTDEQADELAASMRDTTCLPDCQGDCPACLPPEEYDKLHGKTTNTAALSSVLHYEAGQADERARIERDVKVIPTHRIAYAKDGEVRERVPINEYRAAVLAAIRGGEDE